MDSGYNLEVKLPELANGLAVGKERREISDDSQGLGLNKP